MCICIYRHICGYSDEFLISMGSGSGTIMNILQTTRSESSFIVSRGLEWEAFWIIWWYCCEILHPVGNDCCWSILHPQFGAEDLPNAQTMSKSLFLTVDIDILWYMKLCWTSTLVGQIPLSVSWLKVVYGKIWSNMTKEPAFVRISTSCSMRWGFRANTWGVWSMLGHLLGIFHGDIHFEGKTVYIYIHIIIHIYLYWNIHICIYIYIYDIHIYI